MRRQALLWVLAAGLWITSPIAAEPIQDLQLRLASLHNDQPTRIRVDVEVKHRGSAPLHLNKNRKRGTATVVYGSEGVKSLEQRWLGRSSLFSFWRDRKHDEDIPLLDEMDAEDLANPAEMMEFLLSGATLLRDENVTWNGRPARLLVIRPGPFPSKNTEAEAAERDGGPLALEASIWLDESGAPLALERSVELRLGPVAAVTGSQSFTFQEIDGRLLVAEAREHYSKTALAVLRGRDTKTMKVVSVK